jgi:hypothetical protein
VDLVVAADVADYRATGGAEFSGGPELIARRPRDQFTRHVLGHLLVLS